MLAGGGPAPLDERFHVSDDRGEARAACPPGPPRPPQPLPPAAGSNTALIVIVALLVGGLVGAGVMLLPGDDDEDTEAGGEPTSQDGGGLGDGLGDGGGAQAGSSHPPANEGAHGVLLAYMDAVMAGDCETMIALMSDDFVGTAGDADEAVSRCELMIDTASRVEIDRIDLVSEDAERVVYEVTETVDGQTYVENFALVLQDGLWFVDAIA